MKITLKVKSKDKIFSTGFISARMVRKTIEVSQGINFDNMSVDELDELVGFIVELFGGQFSVDDVYDGLASQDLIPTILKCIDEVVGAMREETQGEGKNE